MRMLAILGLFVCAQPALAAPKKAEKKVQMSGKASGAAAAPQIVPLSGNATASGSAK